LLTGVLMVLRQLPSAAAVRRQAVLGVLCQVTYLGLVFTGVREGVPAGIAALIAALQPMLVATAAGPLLGERTDRWQRVGLVLGLCGVVLVVGGDLGGGQAPVWAYLLPVAGMLSLASGTVLERWKPTESSSRPSLSRRQSVQSLSSRSLPSPARRALPPTPSSGSR
jgi:drug/metabolite transporter (DMT)-like permease